MDLALTIAIAAASGSFGAIGVAAMAAGKIDDLKAVIGALNDQHAADAQEIDHLTTRCCQLRQQLREKGQAIQTLHRRVAELEPDAERGKRARLQSHHALQKAQETNRARHAAKRAPLGAVA